MNVKPWITRSFQSDTLVALYPNILMRLRGLPARAEELVADVPREELVRREGDKWSALDHLGHLGDLEELCERRLTEFLAGEERLSAADMSNEATDNARHFERNTDDVLAELRRRREAWVARLDACQAEDFARTARHPRLDQDMRLVDLLVFVAEHDDHHLAQALRLIREALGR